MSSISVITTCMGRKGHLELTIPTLYTQPDEHIVVDWSCPQKSGDWIRATYPLIKVVNVPNQEFFNLCKARNTGAEAATSEWLCFIDADTIVTPSFIKIIKSHLKDDVCITQRNGSLSGFMVCTKEAWSKVRYNDAMDAGWGGDDDEFLVGLKVLGVQEYHIEGYMGSIEHTNYMRSFHSRIKDQNQSAHENCKKRRWDVGILKNPSPNK